MIILDYFSDYPYNNVITFTYTCVLLWNICSPRLNVISIYRILSECWMITLYIYIYIYIYISLIN